MPTPCGTPLCAEHSFQWKIWGPHNRGVTLCEQHKRVLGGTDPADLLYMMLTAKAPIARRGKQQSLPNPFRLRRIINRNRDENLTFDQLGRSIRQIEQQVPTWGNRAQNSYRYMVKTFFETTNGLSGIEVDLLRQVRAFYEQNVGWDVAQLIIALEIVDKFFKPGQPARYRVRLRLNTENKGPFIGRRGATINQLRNSLNLDVDF